MARTAALAARALQRVRQALTVINATHTYLQEAQDRSEYRCSQYSELWDCLQNLCSSSGEHSLQLYQTNAEWMTQETYGLGQSTQETANVHKLESLTTLNSVSCGSSPIWSDIESEDWDNNADEEYIPSQEIDTQLGSTSSMDDSDSDD